MSWKTVNLKLKKGAIFAADGDSALFFRNLSEWWRDIYSYNVPFYLRIIIRLFLFLDESTFVYAKKITLSPWFLWKRLRRFFYE